MTIQPGRCSNLVASVMTEAGPDAQPRLQTSLVRDLESPHGKLTCERRPSYQGTPFDSVISRFGGGAAVTASEKDDRNGQRRDDWQYRYRKYRLIR